MFLIPGLALGTLLLTSSFQLIRMDLYVSILLTSLYEERADAFRAKDFKFLLPNADHSEVNWQQ